VNKQNMQLQFDLVIFDCDGVLVDSELLSAEVLKNELAEAGFPINDEIFRSDFLGRSFATASKRIEARFKTVLPEGFQIRYRQKLLQRMKGRLQAMPGVESVLSGLRTPFCLATSSSPERLAVTLRETLLSRWFKTNFFTASEVANGKPAPDLFLYAACQMSKAPDKSLVIEDSEIGVMAAIAAGMTVWQFTGGAHMAGHVQSESTVRPHRVIETMSALQAAFDKLEMY
jgi:HAD superfamily hydrolase (TIGR01509 family)